MCIRDRICLAALFLTGAYRLIVLYGAHRAAWLMLPVLALLIYTSASLDVYKRQPLCSFFQEASSGFER